MGDSVSRASQRLLLGAFLLLVLLPACHTADTRDSTWEVLDEELRALQVERGLPGLSVAVARGSEVVFARGYGWADREREIAVTPETMFPIGSIEKEFTAAAVLRIAEQGGLSLDDAVTKYLPDLDTAGRGVTIRNMLQQVSGLQETNTAEAWRSRKADSTVRRGPSRSRNAETISAGAGFDADEEIAQFQGVPLYHPPGERWTYSQPNYDLMCLVIASVTGKSYYEATADLAAAAGIPFYPDWTPPPSPDEHDVAVGYAQAADGPRPVRENNVGSAWTTAVGLVRWAHALASGGVVSPSSYAAMTTPVRLNDGRQWFYGMGLVLNTFEGHRMIEHTGNVSGFTSVLTHYPDDDLTIAVMTNLGYTLAASAIKQKLSRRLLGIREPGWLDLPVGPEDRTRFAGVYDAGGFWFEITDDGGGLSFRMREPDDVDAPAVYFTTPLLYQGHGHFVGATEPDVIQVWLEQPGAPAGEIAATIAGSGWRAQAVRRRNERP